MRERALNRSSVALQLPSVCKTHLTKVNPFRRPECSVSFDFEVLEVEDSFVSIQTILQSLCQLGESADVDS